MWSIIKSNFRENKLGSVIVGLLIIMAIVFMIVGTSIMLGINSTVTNKIAELGESDIEIQYYQGEDKADNDKIISRIRSHDNLEDVQFGEAVAIDGDINTSYANSINQSDNSGLTFKPLTDRDDFEYTIVDEQLKSSGHPVYISVMFKNNNSVKIGEEITFTGKNEDVFEMYIAGYIDTVFNAYTPCHYLPEESYNACKAFGNGNEIKIMYVDLISSSRESKMEFNRHISPVINEIKESNIEAGISIDSFFWRLRDTSQSISNIETYTFIMGSVMILFSLLIAIVALVVIRYIIVLNLEGNVKNIGTLKAIGYSNKEIRMAYVLQYFIIFLISALIALVLAFVLIGQFAKIITLVTYITLAIPVNIGVASLSCIVVFMLIYIVLYMVTRRLGKVEPTIALRNGVSNHSFKKNYFSFEKSHVGSNTNLALKSIAHNKKQGVVIVAVVILMTLVASFTSIIFYNLYVNNEAILQVTGVENCDTVLVLSIDRTDGELVFDKTIVENEYVADYVKYMQGYYSANISDNYSSMPVGVDDYEKMNVDFAFDGRMPIYDNEVAISYVASMQSGYGIDDYITLSLDGETPKQYLVCGITQGINNTGFTYFTFDELLNCTENAVSEDKLLRVLFYVYYNDDVSYIDYETYVKDNFTEEIANGTIQMFDSQINMERNVLGPILAGATLLLSIILSLTLGILIMLIVMVVKIKINKEKSAIAINKALGYRSRDIIMQMTVSMGILTVIGSVIGCLLGAFLTSIIFQALVMGYGVINIMLLVNWGYIVGVFVIVPTLVVLLTGISTYGVSKISLSKRHI